MLIRTMDPGLRRPRASFSSIYLPCIHPHFFDALSEVHQPLLMEVGDAWSDQLDDSYNPIYVTLTMRS